MTGAWSSLHAPPSACHRACDRVLYHALRRGHAATAIHLGHLFQHPPGPDPGGSSESETGGFKAARATLFGLAAGGVCLVRSCYQDRGALLPHPFTLTLGLRLRWLRAVCFLWHCPWGRPRRRLSGTVLPRSPDFPPCLPIRWQLAERPSGLLTEVIRGLASVTSSWRSGQEFDI